jgi:hypothetical protein
MSRHTFIARIGRIGILRSVIVPAEIVRALGGAMRIPVTARYAGEITRSTLAPAGGGLSITAGALVLTVVTPQSPVGQALLGRRVGDDVDIRTPQGVRECSIAALC